MNISRLTFRQAVLACLGGLAACLLLAGAVACGSSSRIEADDLEAASVTLFYPRDGFPPFSFPLDLSDEWLRDRLLAAYATMGPWSGDPESLPETDLQLTLELTGERTAVLSIARDDHSFILLEKYEGGDLKDSMYLQPKLMYEFMVDFAEEPGGT